MELNAIVWKEIRELVRDRKTIFSAIILPAVMLPLMGYLLVVATKVTPIKVVILNRDGGDVSWLLISYIKDYLKDAKAEIVITNVTVNNYDILVEIPSNFTNTILQSNPLRFKAAVVKIKVSSKALTSMAFNVVMNKIVNAIRELSKTVAQGRVNLIYKTCCNVTVAPATAVLNPIVIQTEYVSERGKPLSMTEIGKMIAAKTLLFGIFYVSIPVVSFISDSIAGERERKNLETLLSMPIKRRNIVFGKFLATLFLGALAAVANLIGLVEYLNLINSLGNVQILVFDWKIIALHTLAMFVVVGATAAMLMPIVSLSDTVRGAQSLAGVVIMIPLLVIMYGMYGNLNTLPTTFKIIVSLIPHTYAVYAIDAVINGNYLGYFSNLLVTIIMSLIYILITVKIFESEIIITGLGISKARKR